MFPSDFPKLAINGGSPVRTDPWQEHLTIGEAEKRAAIEVLESGNISLFEGSHDAAAPYSFFGGPCVQGLEEAWCEYYGCTFSLSVNSATSGLYAAIGALGIGYGDEVIVSPHTMSACATCALVYGAIPIFADVDLGTRCLDLRSVEEHITPRTRAIVVVHQHGIPADMDALVALASAHDLKIIEDCAQAHGAKYKGRYVGTIGDIGVFSLNVNKTIQTGEGGVCVTDDPDLRYRLALIRNHGEAVVGPAGYENITNILGFNYRLTELQAAIGIEQLKRLDEFNRPRIEYANYLYDELADHACFEPMLRCSCGRGCDECVCTYYGYAFRYLPAVTGVARKDVVAALRAEGMRFGEGYVEPLYMQPMYQRRHVFKHGYPFTASENREIETNYYVGACPNAETLFHEQLINTGIVRLPHSMDDMTQIAEALHKVAACLEGP